MSDISDFAADGPSARERRAMARELGRELARTWWVVLIVGERVEPRAAPGP